jgi:hypothetical protein
VRPSRLHVQAGRPHHKIANEPRLRRAVGDLAFTGPALQVESGPSRKATKSCSRGRSGTQAWNRCERRADDFISSR